MSKASKHVVPGTTGGWAVKNAGSTRASKVFTTQADAVTYARDAAKKAKTELFVHGRDGTIKERNTYGRDPMPPRDKR
jgi:Uncharacterized protein conserved in bacteria (DUF2188)